MNVKLVRLNTFLLESDDSKRASVKMKLHVQKPCGFMCITHLTPSKVLLGHDLFSLMLFIFSLAIHGHISYIICFNR